jgi:hypothetical protein
MRAHSPSAEKREGKSPRRPPARCCLSPRYLRAPVVRAHLLEAGDLLSVVEETAHMRGVFAKPGPANQLFTVKSPLNLRGFGVLPRAARSLTARFRSPENHASPSVAEAGLRCSTARRDFHSLGWPAAGHLVLPAPKGQPGSASIRSRARKPAKMSLRDIGNNEDLFEMSRRYGSSSSHTGCAGSVIPSQRPTRVPCGADFRRCGGTQSRG